MTEEGEAVVFLDSDDEKDKSGEDGKGEEDEVRDQSVQKLIVPIRKFSQQPEDFLKRRMSLNRDNDSGGDGGGGRRGRPVQSRDGRGQGSNAGLLCTEIIIIFLQN